MLSARSVTKEYRSDSAVQTVLADVSIDLNRGGFTVVMGPSGAGKSTLLQVLSGMDRVSSGTVAYGDVRIDELDERGMASLRRDSFGFVFQQSRLIGGLTLLENVAVAGYLNRDRSARQTRAHAGRLLDRMNVGAARDRLPTKVSGGEAQRASIARAIVNEPELLFADEPTGSLNRASTDEVLDLFTELNREGQGILMVTHDQRAALRGDRILYLEDGAVAGELSLPVYDGADLAAREERVSRWLLGMNW